MFKKNLLFVILFILIFCVISLFNYLTDPYNIFFNHNNFLYMSKHNKDMYETILNLSKKIKFDYLVLGSSTTHGLIHKKLVENKKAIYMITTQFDVITQVEYLDFILDIHPEINTIIFPVEYAFYSINDTQRTPSVNKRTITAEDISRLLFSYETTSKSIKKVSEIIENFLSQRGHNIPPADNGNIKEEIFGGTNEISVFTKRNYSDCLTKSFQKNKYDSIEKLKQIIQTKNKNIIFIFPPYHALTQAYLYKINKNDETENIKRYIVKNFPNSKIIDMAFINKYTEEPLEDTNNYRDIVHPVGEPGYLFYCALKYPEAFKNRDIFIQLTPDNIETKLKWQKARLEKYIKLNDNYINTFINYPSEYRDTNIRKIFSMPETCEYYINKDL